jgi:hypothetical protein
MEGQFMIPTKVGKGWGKVGKKSLFPTSPPPPYIGWGGGVGRILVTASRWGKGGEDDSGTTVVDRTPQLVYGK